jgi:hydroxyacylglutathione hydrolase
MKVECVVVGSLATNCYIPYDENNRCGLVIDPGEDGDKILAVIKKLGINVESIVLTHGHFDHTGAARVVRDGTGAPILIGEMDASYLEDPGWMRPFMKSAQGWPIAGYKILREGDIVQAGSLQFTAIETPGHSLGSLCVYSPGHLFTGDLIFREVVGRTDLPGGSGDMLVKSIWDKVLVLPEDTIIYPGHGPKTTVKYEKRHNPFFKHV